MTLRLLLFVLTTFVCLLSVSNILARNTSAADDTLLLVLIYPDEATTDTLQLLNLQAMDSVLASLRDAGYLLPVQKLDSGRTSVFFYYTGPAIYWGEWHIDEKVASWFRRAGVNPARFRGSAINEVPLETVFSQVLRQLENNGYPFANVKIDSLQISDLALSAWIGVDPGPLIRYRNLIMPEEKPVNVLFLTRYLGIIPGQPYREQDILEINNRLQDLEYLLPAAPPVVQFTGEEATVFIFPKRRPANRFDFILGILPKPAGANADRRLQVTGLVDLRLLNPWGTGQSIAFSFRQTRPETQEIRFQFDYPYVLGLPFGTNLAFDLYKRDTAFIDIHWQTAVQYAFSGRHYIEVFWNNHRSNLLSIPTQQILNSRTLPSSLDLSRNSFGLRYFCEKLDYRLNPGRGYAWNISAAAGYRTVRRNAQIINLSDPADPSFSFESLYDEVDQPQFQWMPMIEFQYFQPLGGKHVLHFLSRSMALLSTQQASNNELFRLGGFQTMRGFDEESILTAAFLFGRLEYRYLLDRNAHFHLFTDHGFSPETPSLNDSWRWYLGFGAGIQFETPIGVFGLSYALGRRADLPFDLRTGKIHFGYANMF